MPPSTVVSSMFIGTMFNIMLQGMLTGQVYSYLYDDKKRDKMWLRWLVMILFVAATVNVIFDTVFVYRELVTNFGVVATKGNWIFATEPGLTGATSACVQYFYAWRVQVMTKNIWIVILIVICTTTSMLASIGTSIAVGILPQFANFYKFEIVLIIWLVASILGDIIITFALAYHLRQKKTGSHTTNRLIDHIIKLVVQTGALTATCATLDLIVFLVDRTGTHLIFNTPLSKLYITSMVCSLNARGSWAEKDHDKSIEISVTTWSRRSTDARSTVHGPIEEHEPAFATSKGDSSHLPAHITSAIALDSSDSDGDKSPV